MATIWITYAWSDNEQQDVDFVAQELIRAGLTVKLDRWNIAAGRRLWEQIANFIQSPHESDAWLLYATVNSLGSEACKEEFAYALDRALNTRGGTFPVIALFPSSLNEDLIPAAIRTRLYVSLTDVDWITRVVAAAEGRRHDVVAPSLQPYYLVVHTQTTLDSYAIEVRPRAGSWLPFIAAVPVEDDEKSRISQMLRGAPGHVPQAGTFRGLSGVSDDGNWCFEQGDDEATPTQSYYVFFRELPSRLIFGATHGPQYTWSPPDAITV